MNIMIAEDSNSFIEKLTMSIHGINEISSIPRVSTCEDVMKQFTKKHHELVFLDTSQCNEDVIKISEFIKNENPETILIMLTDSPNETNSQFQSSLKGDYFLDRNKEYGMLLGTMVSILYMASINEKPN